MSKVVIFWAFIPKFFCRIFLRIPIFFPFPHIPNKASPAYHFLDFIYLKKFFRLFKPKNSFLDFLDLKISLNPLKTLRNHLFSLQIDEKNNIFLRLYSKKIALVIIECADYTLWQLFL